MANVESGPTPPTTRHGRSGWEIVGWILVGLLVVGLVGYIALSAMVASAFPALPDLVRPAAVLEGSIRVGPETDQGTMTVEFAASEQAVDAAAAGDGLVYLELDVGDPDRRPIGVEVGVSWRDRAAVVRPLAMVEPRSDVRWTLECPEDDECAGVLELTFDAGGEPSGEQEIHWRLVAEVRPPRGTEVSEDATLTLQLIGEPE
jgi:hypothetical protein